MVWPDGAEPIPVGKNEDGAIGDVDLSRGMAGCEGCISCDHHQLVAGLCGTAQSCLSARAARLPPLCGPWWVFQDWWCHGRWLMRWGRVC